MNLECSCGNQVKKVWQVEVPVMFGGGFLAFLQKIEIHTMGTCGNGCEPITVSQNPLIEMDDDKFCYPIINSLWNLD